MGSAYICFALVAQPGQSEGFVNLRSWVRIPPRAVFLIAICSRCRCCCCSMF